MESIIKVLVCDDMKFMADTIKIAAEGEKDISIVGEAFSSVECVEFIKNNVCDVVLLDIRMENEYSGIDIIPVIRDIRPDIKIIMLTSYTTEDYVFAAFVNGADDYCDKSMDVGDIMKKIRAVYNGENAISPQIAKLIVHKSRELDNSNKSLLYMYEKISKLSLGEYELLREMYYGADYKKIARTRHVELDSVYKMASRMLKKFGMSSTKALITSLKELKIFDIIEQPK